MDNSARRNQSSPLAPPTSLTNGRAPDPRNQFFNSLIFQFGRLALHCIELEPGRSFSWPLRVLGVRLGHESQEGPQYDRGTTRAPMGSLAGELQARPCEPAALCEISPKSVTMRTGTSTSTSTRGGKSGHVPQATRFHARANPNSNRLRVRPDR